MVVNHDDLPCIGIFDRTRFMIIADLGQEFDRRAHMFIHKGTKFGHKKMVMSRELFICNGHNVLHGGLNNGMIWPCSEEAVEHRADGL